MAQSTEDKKKPVSFQLRTPKNVRTTLSRLFRLRFIGTIDKEMFRDLVYAARVMVEIDKHLYETELNKRIETLEQLVRGEGGTVVDNKDLASPFAQALKKQLSSEARINADLNNEILSLKRQLAEKRAEPTDNESVGVA
jgi:hypothetical protein